MKARREEGFTLLELMVVVAIMALAIRLVFLNAGAFIPSWQLNAQARKLASRISFLASEARIQGRTMGLEFNLDTQAVRTNLPPDYSLALVDEETPPQLSTDWRRLDPPLVVQSIEIATKGNLYRGGSVVLPFSPLGTTVDTAILLKNPNYENMETTLLVHGLTGEVEILPGEVHLEEVTENDF